MSTNDWIHCNICFHSFKRKERKFYHLSCRHVLCKPCMAKTNRGTMCPLCKTPLERFTELNNQMERKDKMFYDPGSLKVFGVAYQSVIFQHKQREDMIHGILRCRSAVTQMKEMENAMRQKIVETQRRYEKFRTHRRNLQEGLRQILPRYGAGPPVEQGAGIRTPVQPLTGNRASPQLALANRDGDPASRRYQDKGRPETVTFAASPESSSADFSFGTPAPSCRSATVTNGSFTPAEQQHARVAMEKTVAFQGPEAVNLSTLSLQLFTPQASAERFFREGNKPALTDQDDGGAFADDSGISSMQTPTSILSFAGSSRMAQGMQQQQLKQQQLKQQQLKQQQLKQQQLKQQQLKQQQLKQQQLQQQQLKQQQLKQQQQQHQQLKQQHQQHQQLKQQHQQLKQQQQQLKQQRQHPYTPSTPARHLPGTSSYRHSQIFPPTVPRP